MLRGLHSAGARQVFIGGIPSTEAYGEPDQRGDEENTDVVWFGSIDELSRMKSGACRNRRNHPSRSRRRLRMGTLLTTVLLAWNNSWGVGNEQTKQSSSSDLPWVVQSKITKFIFNQCMFPSSKNDTVFLSFNQPVKCFHFR